MTDFHVSGKTVNRNPGINTFLGGICDTKMPLYVVNNFSLAHKNTHPL